MTTAQRPAIFLDRDGTLIVDTGYPDRPDDVQLLPKAGEALTTLSQAGFALIVISNQSGIGRGLITQADANKVHTRVKAELAAVDVDLDGAYYCPHAPIDRCTCRKPSPELILRAADDHNIVLADSYMVGDKPSDVEAGHLAGCRTILLQSQPRASSSPAADFVAAGWDQALTYILDTSAIQPVKSSPTVCI